MLQIVSGSPLHNSLFAIMKMKFMLSMFTYSLPLMSTRNGTDKAEAVERP